MKELSRIMVFFLFVSTFYLLCSGAMAAYTVSTNTPVESANKLMPLPGNAPTSKEYAAARAKWKEACYLKEYQTAGQHNPEWDAKIVSLIKRIGCSNAGWQNLTAKERADTMAEFDSIRAAGCTDPLLLTMHSTVLLAENMQAKALATSEQAISGFNQSKYSFPMRLQAVNNSYWANIHTDNKDAAKKAALILREWLVKSSEDSVYLNECQGYYVDTFLNYCNLGCGNCEEETILRSNNGNPQAILDLVLSLKNADPWIKAYIAGECHLALGWQDRGGGWAYNVTDSGWKGFSEHLNEARRCLVEAYTLHPKLPHVAAVMISVAMGSSTSEDEERMWFDRSVAAQFDYKRAYSAYLWAIRPRWNGSHAKMLAFGRECLATKRFDTEVPSYFMRALRDIASELPDYGSIFQYKNLWGDISTYFEGRIAAASGADDRNYQYSYYAAVAWVARRPDEATAIYKRLDGKIDELAAHRVRLHANELECLLKICSGAEGAELQKALSSYAAGQTASALSRTVRLAASVKDPDLAWGLNEFLIHQPLIPPSQGTVAIAELLGSQGRTELLFRQWDACVKAGIEGPAAMIISNRVQQYLGQTGMKLAGKLHDDKLDSSERFDPYIALTDGLLKEVPSTNDLEASQHELGMMRARTAWCCIGPVDQRKTTAEDLAKREFKPHMGQCPDKAALLEFVCETLEQEKMCETLKKYLILEHYGYQKNLWKNFKKEETIVSRIKSAAETDEQFLLACKNEFKMRGSLTLAIRLAHLLREKGLKTEARRYEELTVRWLNLLMKYSPHARSAMSVYNVVPGYEHKILDIGSKAAERVKSFTSFWYMMADSYLRLGDYTQAADALARSAECTADTDSYVNPFGFENSQQYADSLKKRLNDQKAKK